MIRFAILAGVSTDAQAREEKLSIPDQIEHCRAFIANNNGIEAAGPYIMDGYSRTGYDSLEVAMREIPPLGRAINEASQYDILLMDNYDRLGDLGFIVKTRFKKLRKQLHSVRQSGRVIPPDIYDPYANDSTDIQMHVEGIIQTYRINKMRRGWNIGVPERARSGLPPLSIPYGYKVSAKNEPPAQISAEIELLRQLKDKFLAGATLTDLCQHAEASGLRPRRGYKWHLRVMRGILQNPFYAGRTIYGRTRRVEKKIIDVPKSKWISGAGRHIPIWDEATYAAILLEFERRDAGRARSQYYTLSGLLICSTCGQTLRRHGRVKTNWIYLNCEKKGPQHIKIRYETALELVAQKVTDELQNFSPVAVETPALQAQIEELQALRVRIQEGFESKLYTAAEASAKMITVEKQIEDAIFAQSRRQISQQTRAAFLEFAQKDITSMREWILTQPPTAANKLLTSLIRHITITPDYELSITWR